MAKCGGETGNGVPAGSLTGSAEIPGWRLKMCVASLASKMQLMWHLAAVGWRRLASLQYQKMQCENNANIVAEIMAFS